MSAADTGTPRRPKVARVLAAALALQVVIGALLVLGDLEPGRLALPGLGPDAPRLSEPVSPGDQRRRFRPDRDLPATRPARDPGALPPRLALTPIEGATWRLEGAIAAGDAGRIIERLAEVSPRPEWLVLQSPGGGCRRGARPRPASAPRGGRDAHPRRRILPFGLPLPLCRRCRTRG